MLLFIGIYRFSMFCAGILFIEFSYFFQLHCSSMQYLLWMFELFRASPDSFGICD